jgi:4-amino-4-deoxy-L-arabinose transferase-like glycosyltransferase
MFYTLPVAMTPFPPFWQSRPQQLLAVMVLLLGIAFFWQVERQPIIEDTIGYLYAAERVAAGHGLTYDHKYSDTAGPYFTMYAFQIRQENDTRRFLGFPPGFPLLLASAILVTGRIGAAVLVVPLLALVGIIIVFLLGRYWGQNEWVGLWAAAILAITPDYWEYGTAAWSDLPAAVVITLGIYLFLLARHKKHRGLSLLAGLLLVFSLYIRYANIIVFPILALYDLAVHRRTVAPNRGTLIRSRNKNWDWLKSYAAVYLPFYLTLLAGLVSLLFFNRYYYGGWLETSYSTTHGWYVHPAFALAYSWGPSFIDGYSGREALLTLWHNFSWLLLLLPLGGYAWRGAKGMMVAGLALAPVALYAFYAFAPSGINSRFLLPALPFLALIIAAGIMTAAETLPQRWWRITAGLLLAGWLLLQLPGHWAMLADRQQVAVNTVRHVERITAVSPTPAVFLSYVFNDHILYYTDHATLNYRRIPLSDSERGGFGMDMLEPCLTLSVTRLLDQNVPIYYIEDRSPPFWDSLAILQRNFRLELVEPTPPIYRVWPGEETAVMGDPQLCRW